MDTILNMVRGDTLAFGIEIEGMEQDLDSAYFSIKSSLSSSDYIVQKSLNDGISKNSTELYTVRLAPSDTQNLEAGQYYYDLQIGVNSDIFTVLRGVINIEADVTRED